MLQYLISRIKKLFEWLSMNKFEFGLFITYFEFVFFGTMTFENRSLVIFLKIFDWLLEKIKHCRLKSLWRKWLIYVLWHYRAAMRSFIKGCCFQEFFSKRIRHWFSNGKFKLYAIYRIEFDLDLDWKIIICVSVIIAKMFATMIPDWGKLFLERF